mmetsp:Transcript_58863/g.164415  ORF Transcript_58863/g.164415 Transcript_58863/m.164415 type:complete len:541 (+) Transcript_58863:137-1759(+)
MAEPAPEECRFREVQVDTTAQRTLPRCGKGGPWCNHGFALRSSSPPRRRSDATDALHDDLSDEPTLGAARLGAATSTGFRSISSTTLGMALMSRRAQSLSCAMDAALETLRPSRITGCNDEHSLDTSTRSSLVEGFFVVALDETGGCPEVYLRWPSALQGGRLESAVVRDGFCPSPRTLACSEARGLTSGPFVFTLLETTLDPSGDPFGVLYGCVCGHRAADGVDAERGVLGGQPRGAEKVFLLGDVSLASAMALTLRALMWPFRWMHPFMSAPPPRELSEMPLAEATMPMIVVLGELPASWGYDSLYQLPHDVVVGVLNHNYIHVSPKHHFARTPEDRLLRLPEGRHKQIVQATAAVRQRLHTGQLDLDGAAEEIVTTVGADVARLASRLRHYAEHHAGRILAAQAAPAAISGKEGSPAGAAPTVAKGIDQMCEEACDAALAQGAIAHWLQAGQWCGLEAQQDVHEATAFYEGMLSTQLGVDFLADELQRVFFAEHKQSSSVAVPSCATLWSGKRRERHGARGAGRDVEKTLRHAPDVL